MFPSWTINLFALHMRIFTGKSVVSQCERDEFTHRHYHTTCQVRNRKKYVCIHHRSWHSIVLFHQCSSCIFINLPPRIHPRIHRFHPSFPPIPNPSELPRMKTCLANSMRLPRLPLQAMFLIDKGVVSLLSLFENGRHKRRAATNRMTSVHMSVFPLQITPPPKGQLEMGCDLLLMFLQLLFIQTI
jgi:hypothetical protein